MTYIVTKTSMDIEKSMQETTDDRFANNCPVAVVKTREEAEAKAKEFMQAKDNDRYAYIAKLEGIASLADVPVEIKEFIDAD